MTSDEMTTETLSFFASPWWLRTRALWQRVARLSRRTPRRLRLRESLPLGEHRFVAVIEFERRRLLIGGTPSSLVLLAHLDADLDADLDSDRADADANANKHQSEFAEGRPVVTQLEERKPEERKPEEPTAERKRQSF